MTAGGIPTPNYAAILDADTRLTWLQRTDLDHFWITHPATGEPVGTAGEGDPLSAGFYFCLISEREFDAFKNRLLSSAPVWPGVDNVVLGDPVALSSDLSIDGPMDGVLMSVTTPPTGLGKFAMGGLTAYYRIGEIAFVNDVGVAEPWQYLSWDEAHYCPKATARAASCILRVLAGAGGTATPWLAK
jgi:hypothetical protein